MRWTGDTSPLGRPPLGKDRTVIKTINLHITMGCRAYMLAARSRVISNSSINASYISKTHRINNNNSLARQVDWPLAD